MSQERKRSSFGQYHVNLGTTLEVSKERYKLDHSRKFYLFDVIPVAAVRMSSSDRWKTNPNHPDPKKRQRKAVTKYWAFKNVLTAQANMMKFTLKKTVEVVFLIPMPDTWSAKKKEQMNGMPHETTPDTDNLVKALKDTLRSQDSDIWWEKAEKRWAYRGSIIIFG
jgi:Holliday junction resolvase RusA-like endonuclease